MQFQHNKIWRWYANRNIMTQKVDLFWMGSAANGDSHFREFKEIEETVINSGEMYSPKVATMSLDYDEADTLMQEMWNAGLRPKGVESGVAQVDALQKHIDSLQKTVDHFMDINSLPVMEELTQAVEPSPFDKLSMDFKTLWNKVDAMADSLSHLITSTENAKKAAESLEKAAKKI